MQPWMGRRRGDGRNASSRSHQRFPEAEVPTQLSFAVTRVHQLLPGPLCHQQGCPAPSAMAWPCPGYPGLTPLSLFSHAFFVASWKKQCCLIFPGRSFISIPTSCTRSHTERDRVNLFILLADFCFSALCFSVQFIRVQIHRNQTALPRIHLCSRNCSRTALFSPLLLCTFLSSLHLLQCCSQRPSSNHRCAHRSGSIRAYYLIFPTIQILKSIFLP